MTLPEIDPRYDLPTDVHQVLWDAYHSDDRVYHTHRHIWYMSRQAKVLNCSREQWLAIQFHDAVYNPLASDNEEKSCELFTSLMGENKIVTDIIMSTKKHFPINDEAEIVLDLDLMILGESWEVYSDYIWQIREEYKDVPDDIFYPGRLKVLSGFLDRTLLYYTEWGRKNFDAQARKNLSKEIEMIKEQFPKL